MLDYSHITVEHLHNELKLSVFLSVLSELNLSVEFFSI